MGSWYPWLASPVSLERPVFYYIGKRFLVKYTVSGEIYKVSSEIYEVSGEMYEVSSEMYTINGCRCV